MEHADFVRTGRGTRPVHPHPVLRVADVTRHFATGSAVQGVSLEVHAGQVTCLLGPSGCGKSTTLRMIAGIEAPDSGEIFIDGARVAGPDCFVPPERRPVGMVFQDLALFPHMTVAKNVAFGMAKARRREGDIAQLLDRVGLADAAGKYPHELSGGEQQRIALVRALATEPRVMLLDEPFSSLDQRLRVDMRELALDLLREAGTAVVLVTHDPDEAMMMADRIAIMHKGRIRQEGEPLDLYRRPVDLMVARFFSDLNLLRGRVSGGRVETPFGSFPAPGLAEGTPAVCAIRPEHLRICPPGPDHPEATVIRARNLGREAFVEVTLPGMQDPFRSSRPGATRALPGQQVGLCLDSDAVMVMPDE